MVRNQGIKSRVEYNTQRDKLKGVFNGWRIPSSPQTHYPEWKGWGEFLGKPPMAPYEELKKMVRNQGIKKSKDYRLLRKESGGVINGWRIPSNPHVHYGNKWEGWDVFFNKCETVFKEVSHR